jgi:hypothetical protein
MRRVLLLAGVTALAVAAMAASASAQRTTTLSVIAVQKSQHRVSHTRFISKGALVRSNRVVGHYRARFTFRRHSRNTHINAVAKFRRGSLKVNGTQGPGDNRVPIIGGTGRFNGAAGKLKTHNLGHNQTLLTFVFVQ